MLDIEEAIELGLGFDGEIGGFRFLKRLGFDFGVKREG